MAGLLARRSVTEEENTVRQLREALKAWKDAENFFANVSDPDLVDCAVYDLESARRRYMYMLKRYRADKQVYAFPNVHRV